MLRSTIVAIYVKHPFRKNVLLKVKLQNACFESLCACMLTHFPNIDSIKNIPLAVFPLLQLDHFQEGSDKASLQPDFLTLQIPSVLSNGEAICRLFLFIVMPLNCFPSYKKSFLYSLTFYGNGLNLFNL